MVVRFTPQFAQGMAAGDCRRVPGTRALEHCARQGQFEAHGGFVAGRFAESEVCMLEGPVTVPYFLYHFLPKLLTVGRIARDYY